MQDFFFLGDAARETLHGFVKAEKRNIVLKIGHKLYLFKAETENIMLKNGHKLYKVIQDFNAQLDVFYDVVDIQSQSLHIQGVEVQVQNDI